MQADDGGEAAVGPPTKRTRRPSVRLHEPYYENPLIGHRKPNQRHSDGAKKHSIAKTAHAKNSKKDDDDASGAGQGEDIKFDDISDDLAIGKWKDFNVSKTNRAFERKRFRPSGSKKSSSGKQVEEEEEDGINSNLVVEDSDPPSPSNQAFLSDDRNDKLSDSNNNNINNNNNGDKNQQRGLKNRNVYGVRAWLKELGLDKYSPLFEVHEVDDEVLGQLTLEDLKEMGINAVGSRRKIYASIQKLGEGLS